MIKVDLKKAKEIKKDSLRAQRKPLLEELDIKYIRANEQGEDVSKIVVEKQRLRDITKEVDKLNTIEELKKFNI